MCRWRGAYFVWYIKCFLSPVFLNFYFRKLHIGRYFPAFTAAPKCNGIRNIFFRVPYNRQTYNVKLLEVWELQNHADAAKIIEMSILGIENRRGKKCANPSVRNSIDSCSITSKSPYRDFSFRRHHRSSCPGTLISETPTYRIPGPSCHAVQHFTTRISETPNTDCPMLEDSQQFLDKHSIATVKQL
jgi:hypothetical protein